MTKSRQSVTKLRLSRLVRCLVAVGCLKLAIMGAAILDLPMPAWRGASEAPAPVADQAPVESPATEIIAEIQPEPVKPESIKVDEPMPQGSAAAELAAAAKPRKPFPSETTALPVPLVTAGPGIPLDAGADLLGGPDLPAPLGAPLARAGVIMPEPVVEKQVAARENVWDVLNLKSLPFPGLGGVQAAHAASLDMPVPATPKTDSPFAPAEQAAPLGNSPRVLPGAPPIASIPSAKGVDGAPLPPGQGNFSTGGASPPAPNIQPQPSPLNPNMKAQELARQQQDILMLRQQMDQRLKELQTAEDKMKDMIREAKEVEDKKVRSLVQMYANMKPRTAAQALENMDERIAVRILSGMAPKQSGEILTYTNPVKTAKFTEMITRMRMGE